MKDFKTISLILVSVIIFLLFYFPNKITKMKHTQDILSEFTSGSQIKEEFYNFNFEINNKMTGLTSPDIICKENKTDEVKLSALVEKKPLLLYRYADINCNTCYEAELKALQEEFSESPNLVSVICSYRVDQEFIVFKKINKIRVPLFRIDPDAFSWDVENYLNPYYFVLHPDMKISHIYVPNKVFPELNKQYLEGVKRFLSE